MKQIRASYSLIRKKYIKAGKKTVRLTQSSLILMQAIVGTTSAYTFPILTTDQTPPQFPEEIRLNQNDEFVSYEMGYYLAGDMTTGDPAVFRSKYFGTYAPIELNSTFLNCREYANGNMKILVNNISRLEKWDLKKHEKVQRTQFQNSAVGQPFATTPSIDFSDDGMFPMQPMLTLSGGKKNEITATLVRAILPTGSGNFVTPDAVTINLTIKQLMVMFRGLLAQNATKFQ